MSKLPVIIYLPKRFVKKSITFVKMFRKKLLFCEESKRSILHAVSPFLKLFQKEPPEETYTEFQNTVGVQEYLT